MVSSFFSATSPLLLTLRHEGTLWKCGLCLSNISKQELETTRQHFLHPNEQAYFSTLLYPKRQYSYLLGRYCAKKAVSVYTPNFHNLTEIWIETGVFQQPIVNHPALKNVQVSISHNNTMGAALAFSEAFPMGIDIEEISINKISTIEDLVSLSEKRLCSSRDTITILTRLWTAKEALSKVLKCGLTIPFELLEVEEMEEEGSITISYFKNFKQYQAASFFINESVCSIVYPQKATFVFS